MRINRGIVETAIQDFYDVRATEAIVFFPSRASFRCSVRRTLLHDSVIVEFSFPSCHLPRLMGINASNSQVTSYGILFLCYRVHHFLVGDVTSPAGMVHECYWSSGTIPYKVHAPRARINTKWDLAVFERRCCGLH